MHGSRFCAATSCARRCFFTVSGKYEPPFTVASFATMTHWRPSTTPTPVTIPALGASPSYSSQAASAFSSRNELPGSTSRSIRARAVILARDLGRPLAQLGDEFLHRHTGTLMSGHDRRAPRPRRLLRSGRGAGEPGA